MLRLALLWPAAVATAWAVLSMPSCSATQPDDPPRPAPVELMARQPDASILPRAEASPGPPQPPAGPAVADANVRVHGLGAHFAAVHLAEVFGVNVVVVGGSHEPVHFDVKSIASEEVFRALAASAGLDLARTRSIFVMGPAANLAHIDDKQKLVVPRDREVDFHFVTADFAKVTDLISQVTRVGFEGEYRGEISILARAIRAGEIMDTAMRLSGVPFRQQGRVVSVDQPVALPSIAGTAPTVETCEVERPMRAIKLRCVPGSELTLGAISWVEESRRVAALGRAGQRPGGDMYDNVRVGDYVGKATDEQHARVCPMPNCVISWKVADITAATVELVIENEKHEAVYAKSLRLKYGP